MVRYHSYNIHWKTRPKFRPILVLELKNTSIFSTNPYARYDPLCVCILPLVDLRPSGDVPLFTNEQKLFFPILGRHNEILRIRRQQSNINATIGRLSSILPALLEMKKLEAKMKLGKYYSALKIIQLIRHEHLENCRQVNRN